MKSLTPTAKYVRYVKEEKLPQKIFLLPEARGSFNVRKLRLDVSLQHILNLK